MKHSFWILIVFVNVYTVIPTLVIRGMGVGAHKEQTGRGIALTFDDGPDP